MKKIYLKKPKRQELIGSTRATNKRDAVAAIFSSAYGFIIRLFWATFLIKLLIIR